MSDPRAVSEAVQRQWAAAAERSARAITSAQRQLAEAQRAIRERAERQAQEWGASARALGRKPDVEVEELEFRSEEEHERREDHESLLDRTARRNRAAADAAEAGEDILLDAFKVAPKPLVPKPDPAPEPEVAAYLPRSMRARARRRTDP
ncbi:hypothetical protein [Labedaea rhizosphaerae]|uniref:Colicin import membrane protein n=1 Tax=Labedaea rhizosphaerae TaxID=598644 RepID=A0A4R6SPB1_LABRH|nr:hypothetical protein [Labedaea rhizosphaerae]TDQ05791.1 hypothetical protein EV186_1011769 [Labedaea rhizosphaerae]